MDAEATVARLRAALLDGARLDVTRLLFSPQGQDWGVRVHERGTTRGGNAKWVPVALLVPNEGETVQDTLHMLAGMTEGARTPGARPDALTPAESDALEQACEREDVERVVRAVVRRRVDAATSDEVSPLYRFLDRLDALLAGGGADLDAVRAMSLAARADEEGTDEDIRAALWEDAVVDGAEWAGG